MNATDLALLARGDRPSSGSADAPATIPPPRRRWRTRVLLPALVVAASVALFAVAAGDAFWPATPVRVVPAVVKSDAAAQPAGTVVVQAPGWVEADPFPVAVTALTDGIVEEVLVLEGQPVAKDQIVARLVADDAEIALRQAEATLSERAAELAAAEARLEEARRNWEHPVELRRKVQTAEAQLAETRAELRRWPAELAREAAHLVYLKAEFDRLEPLHEAGQASDIELVQARQAYETQKAQVEATQRREDILEARVAALEAERRAARANLERRIADTRAVAEAEAAVQRARAARDTATAQRDDAVLRFERMDVRSPAAGIAMVRLVEPGAKVVRNADNPRSAQVLRLYDPAKLQVRVDVPLVDAAKVGVGQRAEVIVDVLPDRTFDGVVTRVVHEADVQKNTLQVKVAIEDPSPEIKPEMLARARFLAQPDPAQAADEQEAERLFVPAAAVQQSEGAPFVWLADQTDGTARRTPVSVGGATPDGWTAIIDGLRPGDRVIVEAPPALADGDRIQPVEE